NRESELRELYRDVRLDARLVYAREYALVLAHLALCLGGVGDALVEMVEGGRAAVRVHLAYGRDGRLDVVARDEAGRHLLERLDTRGEVFQSLLPREV